MFLMLLKENSTYAKVVSHCLGWLLLIHRMRLPSVRFMTYVCPSVCGCLVVLNLSSVENFFHNVLQNWLRNLISLSKVIDLGTLYNLTISQKKRLAMYTASDVFLQAKKCAILLYLSTTTKTESKPFWVFGSPKTKSMVRFSQMILGMGSGVYNPVFWLCPLHVWQIEHMPTKLVTSRQS